jgi:hypothetical protein
MNAEQATTVITNILTSGGVITFLWFLVRGLKKQIYSLNKTIEAQNKTLEVMEKRIVETERVGDIYKNLINELPDYIEKYKSIIRVTKDEMISELEKANQLKDEKLKSTTEIELKKIEIQEQIIAELPKLRDELLNTQQAIGQRVDTIRLFLVSGAESEELIDFKRAYYQAKFRRWEGTPHKTNLLDYYYQRLVDYYASRQLSLFDEDDKGKKDIAEESTKESNDI